jgi:uncharacterized protein with HEPN domain
MVRRVELILEEILAAIDGIEQSVAERGIDALECDWLLQRGVERGIEIISEAVRHVPDDMLAELSDMPWREIRSIGNRIRHEYHRVSPAIIRSVLVDNLPVLRTTRNRRYHAAATGGPGALKQS